MIKLDELDDFRRDMNVVFQNVEFPNDGRIRFVLRYPKIVSGVRVESAIFNSRATRVLINAGYRTLDSVGKLIIKPGFGHKMAGCGTGTEKAIVTDFFSYYYTFLSRSQRVEFWQDAYEATWDMLMDGMSRKENEDG